jgi:Protein of unknown function (DUF3455)
VKLLILLAATVLGFAALAQAQTPAPPQSNIPASLQTPAGEKLILQAHATGWQIYTCGAGADGKPRWTLKAPDADLHDEKGAVIGHHAAGPSWKYKDGSQVIGKAIAHVDTPAPDMKRMAAPSIPWLLVSAVGHSGDGLFARVTSIQRLHTEGGQPPPVAECDLSKPSAEARSSYAADYYFYAPAK